MTKSVTALVLGVAIDRGIIADVDQSVLSFFPDYANLRTPDKDRITIRRFGAKPDKKIVDRQAASPSSWKTPCIAIRMAW
jgi:hypothetical protein